MDNYLYGIHPVIEAVESGKKIEKVFLKQGMEGPAFKHLLELVTAKQIAFQFVPAQKLNSLVHGAHQGVVAYMAQIDYVPFEEMVENALKAKKAPLFFLLDGVSDVRNFGAIARSAECAAVDGIIVPAKGGAAINADAVKASAGALLRISTSKTTNLKMALYYLLENGFQIVAATEKTDRQIYDIDFTKPTAVVMGSEGKGISQPILSLCTESAKIPMLGSIGSLNVSVAASIVMYEAVRQRVQR
ncbi:MAG: 23S rRNA (guanosine(2251)-2'-O)-methyltransferase RlmB [Bacteroidales bacterium]|nr:23S rRNA (guanosine(2251)-2'-O)-methyltransferase RlmB [Bacteroidales bacterium]